ncbi:maintenance of telomere capping protein 1 [Monosporozyma unispora]|nr:hypothetical protein C6P44_000186 [Kazachstania unispora]
MSEKKVSTEADDVFEFLDSLPQDKEGSATPATDLTKEQGSTDKTGTKGKKDDDIFEFLEELEKSSKKDEGKAKKATPAKKPKKEEEEEEEAREEAPKEKEEQLEEREGTPLNDPITSISNWWSSSGSARVSSLWNKTQEQANQIKDKLAETDAAQQATSMLPGVKLSNLNTNNLMNITDQIAKNLTKIVVGDTEEVLRIHLVHDLINVPYLQYYVEEKFDQVMSSQVEGGIRIFVDEWGKPTGKESTPSSNGTDSKVNLNVFQGKVNDGDKLAFANLDNSIKLFNKAHEKVVEQQGDDANANNDNISDIFISILPISIPNPLNKSNDDITTTDTTSPDNFHFTVVLKDVSNDISSITRSQGFPLKWLNWLEGSKIDTAKKGEDKKKEKKESEDDRSESEDEEIAVDPSEWVQQWIEDGVSLVLGVVAQNYVIERMGF